jgi:hypothetical protein
VCSFRFVSESRGLPRSSSNFIPVMHPLLCILMPTLGRHSCTSGVDWLSYQYSSAAMAILALSLICFVHTDGYNSSVGFLSFMDGHDGTVHISSDCLLPRPVPDRCRGWPQWHCPLVLNSNFIAPMVTLTLLAIVLFCSMLRPSAVVAGLFFVLRWDSLPIYLLVDQYTGIYRSIKPISSICC